MALRNLSGVTSTLINLLRENIRNEINGVNVTSQSPDSVGVSLNTISLYLFHITEEAYYTNIPGPGNDIPNIANNPMALCLYYVVTAHHDSQNDDDALTQQHLMGLVIKTLHDFPIITDNTMIGGISILVPELRGANNNLQIIMRPTTPEEAISFWSAEDQQITRLSVYYEVRVVLLEPETPLSQPGLVLSIGTFLFDIGTPHLESSLSTVRFTLPQQNGGSVQAIEAKPARVSLDNAGPANALNNRLIIQGTNLAIGRSRQLLLRNTLWTEQGFDPVLLDPDLNTAWNLEFASDQIILEMQSQLFIANPNGGAPIALNVLPGIYTTLLRIVKDEQVINNALKQITVNSNEIGFLVTPRLTGPVPAVPAGNTIAINVGPQFDILSPSLPNDSIEIVIDGVVYMQGTAPLASGEFSLSSVPGISNTITINPVFTLPVISSQAFAFRLLVNGAESPPFWLELAP